MQIFKILSLKIIIILCAVHSYCARISYHIFFIDDIFFIFFQIILNNIIIMLNENAREKMLKQKFNKKFFNFLMDLLYFLCRWMSKEVRRWTVWESKSNQSMKSFFVFVYLFNFSVGVLLKEDYSEIFQKTWCFFNFFYSFTPLLIYVKNKYSYYRTFVFALWKRWQQQQRKIHLGMSLIFLLAIVGTRSFIYSRFRL